MERSLQWVRGGIECTTVLASWKSEIASGPRSRPIPLCLKPPSAKPSLIADHAVLFGERDHGAERWLCVVPG